MLTLRPKMGVGQIGRAISHSASPPRDLFDLMDYVEESAEIADVDIGREGSDSDNALAERGR